MNGYVLHGLRIASELPLGDEVPLDRDPDLEIRAGAVDPAAGDPLASFPYGGEPFYTLHRDGDAWVLDVAVLGILARIEEDLRTVTVSPGPDGDALAGIVAVGAILGLLLDLRGDTALHASAVEIDGAAVAFVGPSGAGKSTLAALTSAAGAGLITDDLLRVELRDGAGAICHRGAPALRLRQHAVQVADEPRVVEAVQTADRRLAVRLPPASSAELPLRAIVVPALMRGATEVAVEPLRDSRAVAALVGAGRFAGWRTRDGLTSQFDRAARLAQHVTVARVVVPWERPVPPRLGAEVLAAVRGALSPPRS